MAGNEAGRHVVLGQVNGLFGVRGWVKVFSHTDPRENILRYGPWRLTLEGRSREFRVLEGRRQGKGIVARLEGLDDRDQAAAWLGAEISVPREQLPEPGPGEYYWADLIGLEVKTMDGVALGRVSHLFRTGANDVMVVQGERERLVPFVQEDVVREVDLEAGRIRVVWDPEF